MTQKVLCGHWEAGPLSRPGFLLRRDRLSTSTPQGPQGKGHSKADLGEKAPLSFPGNPSENHPEIRFKGITTVAVTTYSASPLRSHSRGITDIIPSDSNLKRHVHHLHLTYGETEAQAHTAVRAKAG